MGYLAQQILGAVVVMAIFLGFLALFVYQDDHQRKNETEEDRIRDKYDYHRTSCHCWPPHR